MRAHPALVAIQLASRIFGVASILWPTGKGQRQEDSSSRDIPNLWRRQACAPHRQRRESHAITGGL